MESVDLTRQSGNDGDPSTAKYPKSFSVDAEDAFVDLTIGDSQETDDDTRQAAEFLLATAAKAPLSRSPSSPLPMIVEPRVNGHNEVSSSRRGSGRSSFQKTSAAPSPADSPLRKKIHRARKGAPSSGALNNNLPTRGLRQPSSYDHNLRSSRSRSPRPFQSPGDHMSTPVEKAAFRDAATTSGPLEMSLAIYETEVRRLLQDMRLEHGLILQSRLASSREIDSRKVQNFGNASKVNPMVFQDASPFANMQPNSIPESEESMLKYSKEIGNFTVSSGPTVQNVSAQQVSYRDQSRIIPPFSNYVSVKKNLLTKNDDSRTYIPYHGDDFMMTNQDDYAALEEKFERNKVKHRRACSLSERARIWAPYVSEFLEAIGCPAETAIAFLAGDRDRSSPPRELPKDLAPVWHALKGSQLTDRKRIEKRMSRRGARNGHLSTNHSSGRQLAAACVASKAFSNVTGISLWHVLKHEILANEQPSPSSGEKNTEARMFETYTKLECLVCNMHECPGHGEYDSEDDSRVRVSYATNMSVDRKGKGRAGLATSDLEKYTGLDEDGTVSGTDWTQLRTTDQGYENHETCSEKCFWIKKHRIPPLPSWPAEEQETLASLRSGYQNDLRGACMIAQTGLIKRPCVEIFLMLIGTASQSLQLPALLRNENAEEPTRLPSRKPASFYTENPATNKTHIHQDRQPFTPCAHAGPCDESHHCICANQHIVCEKTCACPPNCPRRFRGCRCVQRGKICRENDRCECWALNRECDPDLCRSCGAAEVLDAANRHREDITEGRCSNIAIQRGVPKRTILGDSKIMASAKKKREGLGLYLGEPCKKGDFIGEYVGEIISEAETERREAVYDKRNLSYLFTLNRDQTVDSTFVGNKTRFINCERDTHANTLAKVLFCNGVQRIGLFALRAIEPGEELCFNYGEAFMRKLVPSKGPKANPAAAAPKRGRVQKCTLSKNGIRIGRPPKNPHRLLGPHERLSSSVPSTRASAGTATTAGTPRSARKRRRSEVYDSDSESSDADTDASTPAFRSGARKADDEKEVGAAVVEEDDEEEVDPDDSEDPSFSDEESGSAVSMPDEEMADAYGDGD